MARATFAQYQAAAKRIARVWGAEEGYGPIAVRDWNGDGRHAIVWEDGAPYDWTYLIDGGTDEEFGIRYTRVAPPKGFFFEPITHYALGIYEA